MFTPIDNYMSVIIAWEELWAFSKKHSFDDFQFKTFQVIWRKTNE